MNTVLVLIDSLNRNFLSSYGQSLVATPNLDAFAQRAWRMENHFVGSLPCMPARREIFAGRKELMWRPWGPLEPYDARLPRLLQATGHTTAIVTDHYHYWEEAANGYLQSFQSTELIRGHELDSWKPPHPAHSAIPRWVENIEVWRRGKGRQYFANVEEFKGEEDFFPARVMTTAANWLHANARHGPFYLQVESFDVHEPFHVPEPYASMYGRGADMDRFTLWPPYQNYDDLRAFMATTSEEELAFIRSQYAGKLTMVDRWFGKLLEAFDALRLWDNTMIIVTTDHGHDLGERQAFGKQYPHYDSHANIPLFLWHPDAPGAGRAISGLTSTVDLFATILDATNTRVPEPSHSRSMLPLLVDAGSTERTALLYGSFGQGICCTDGEWTLFRAPRHDRLFSYSPSIFKSLVADTLAKPVEQGFFIPGVEYPQWKTPIGLPLKLPPLCYEDFLFNRREDPGQKRNLWSQEVRQCERMLDVMRGLLVEEGCPPEQYERFGLER